MWGAAITELVGTTCLLFTLTISIVACLNFHEVESKLLVPIVVFVILFFFLMATIPISGGHMNPVFTFIATLKGIITITRAAFYFLAQCLGSIISFIIIKSVMNHDSATKFSLGGCSIKGHGSTGLHLGVALMLEFSCTFLVLFVAVNVAFDKRRSKELGVSKVCAQIAGAMALAVFVSITVTGQTAYAGAGLNPAKCFGAAILQGGLLWKGHWVFWVGSFFACIVYYGFSLTLPKQGLDWVEGEYDAMRLAKACWGTKDFPNSSLQEKGDGP